MAKQVNRHQEEGKEPSIYDKMQLVLRTGKLMLECGADTKRCVRDMLRTAAYLGMDWQKLQLHMAYTTIMLNVYEQGKSYTMFCKCYRHGVDLKTNLQVSGLSWQALRGKYSFERYDQELGRIEDALEKPLYSHCIRSLGAGLACSSFCRLFGGDLLACCFTLVASIIGWWLRFWGLRLEINTYVCTALAATLATLVAFVSLSWPLSSTPWYPMVACTLFLVPGVHLINAVDDFLNNYLISGLARLLHGSLTVVAMTFGIVFALTLCKKPEITELAIMPQSLYFSQGIAAALAALGFAIIFNVPKRLLAIAALGSSIAVCLRNFLAISCQIPLTEATFVGAAAVSIVGFILLKSFHAPFFVITIPAVIPLIPGVLLYRLLYDVILINQLTPGELLVGLQNGIEGALIILAISLGVTLPDVVAHQFIEHRKQKQLYKLLLENNLDSSLAQKFALDRASKRG